MDPIKIIKEDHKAVEKLFKSFEGAGRKAYKEKRQLADRIIAELTTHAEIEEEVFYPVMQSSMKDGEELVKEAEVEHGEAKKALEIMKPLSGEDSMLGAKMAELIGGVRHHVKEEEEEMLPELREAMDSEALSQLGERLAEAKKARQSSAA